MVDNPTRNTSYTPQGRIKLLAKKKKKNVLKAGVIDVDIENPDINIPQTLETSINNQLVEARDKSTNKRKAIKGLRARTPAKIKKNYKGEKRLHPLDWYESERKKKKQYNIVRNEGKINYDMWRL
jgi:aspartate/methionine/tyrosine aminotransferase